MVMRNFSLAVVLAVCCSTVMADEPWVRLEGNYWMPRLSADARFTDNGIGTEFDLEDDLGIDDEDFPGGRIEFRLGKNHRLRLGYTRVNYEGDNVLTRTIVFGEETYNKDARVLSEFDMHYGQIGWTWQFINLFDRSVRFGTILDLKGFGIKAELEAPDIVPAISEDADIVFGFPTVGLALDIVPLDGITLYAEAAGISAGSYGWFADGEAGVRISPMKNLSIIGGYRIMRIDIEVDDDFVDMEIAGPFAGASLNF